MLNGECQQENEKGRRCGPSFAGGDSDGIFLWKKKCELKSTPQLLLATHMLRRGILGMNEGIPGDSM